MGSKTPDKPLADPAEPSILDTFMLEVGGKQMSLGEVTPNQLKAWVRANEQKLRMIRTLYPDKAPPSDDDRE